MAKRERHNKTTSEPPEMNYFRKCDLLFNFEFEKGLAFDSEEERYSCWAANREELMREHADETWRPGAWWEYDSGIPSAELLKIAYRGNNLDKPGGYVDEGELLARLGLA